MRGTYLARTKQILAKTIVTLVTPAALAFSGCGHVEHIRKPTPTTLPSPSQPESAPASAPFEEEEITAPASQAAPEIAQRISALKTGIEKGDACARCDAAKKLGAIALAGPRTSEMDEAVPALVGMLGEKKQDSSYYVVDTATDTLATIGKPAIAYLFRVMGNTENPEMRVKSITALGKIAERNPEARDAILVRLAGLLDSEDPGMRSAAIRAIAKTGPSAVPVLISVLNTSDNPDAIVAVINAIVEIGEPAVPALQEAAASKETDGNARSRISSALTAIKASGDLRYEGLKSEDDDVRGKAAMKIHKIIKINPLKAAEAVGPLLGAMNDPNWMVRALVIEALGETRDKRAVPALVKAMKKDKKIEVRKAATTALGRIGDETAVPALLDALSDRKIRQEAAVALHELDQNGSTGLRCRLSAKVFKQLERAKKRAPLNQIK